ncbi:D-alanine--D-alanine ligase family protein [Petroclostridium sp. X23]|uniref:D-alanine--D-alanine ligase family protein n=1 Tax=Petroclostridium sp. X23 TaxID=3045146 RepID=UPI0024AE7804|nr:D-alanine--D-alanine ligase family protein [Petroclostridium sp. X23]WHH57367.1 D-alanine--D-alanine ligase family protein [Petroclostridium sp. X23]
MAQKLTVCVLFGGQSSEHEVSRISAVSVIKNLDKEKYDIVMIGITKKGKWLMYQGPVDKIETGEWENGHVARAMISPDGTINGIVKLSVDENTDELTATTAKIDVVFPVLHGLYGEDGTVQGLFELAQIPYVGSGILASSVSMDKIYAKLVFKDAQIPQAQWEVVYKYELDAIEKVVERIESCFEYPCFIKPSNAGSSVGVTKAHNRQELEKGLVLAAQHDRKILVEEFINGREIECSVLGNLNPKASVVGEIIPGREFYDYDAKYNDDTSQLLIPAALPEETANKVKQYAVSAYKALDCAGLSRVDFFVHKETDEVFINEINTMPGFTSISMYPKLWEASGISYPELLDQLIALAMKRE